MCKSSAAAASVERVGAPATPPLQLLAGLLRRSMHCVRSPASDGGTRAGGAIHDQAEPMRHLASSALRPRPPATRRWRRACGGLLPLRARRGPPSRSRPAELEVRCASQRKGMRTRREDGHWTAFGSRREKMGENAYLGCLSPSTQNRCSIWLFCWKHFFHCTRPKKGLGNHLASLLESVLGQDIKLEIYSAIKARRASSK